ncbi:hypothetical protein ACTFIY_004772 [Dictyostelium cf. discoideum]
MILKYDTSFSLSFPVGKKYVIGQFHLKCGEEVSSAVDQFMNEYDIPCYFRISLLNTIENLIKQDKILTKDNDDIEIILNIKDGEIIFDHHENNNNNTNNTNTNNSYISTSTIINQLSNQYSEKIQYWNKLAGSKESEEQKQQEERISTFLYLVDKNSDTRERIINQEELFATETSILLVKKQDDLKQLNEKHSREMEDAFRNSLQPDQVELIVAQNMKQVDEFDQYYDHEINILKQKQKFEFSKFLNDLYWLEKTKDDLDEIESFNSQQQPQTPQKQQQQQQQQQTAQQPQPSQQQSSGGIIDSIGQNLDKGVARASSFFSFGFNKKNNQTPPINSPPSTPQLSSDDSNSTNNVNNNSSNNNTQSKPIGINNNNNNNSNNRQRTDSQVSPPNSLNSSSPNKPPQPTTPLNSNNNSSNNNNNNNNNNSIQRKSSTGSSNTNSQPTLQRKQSGGAGNIPIINSSSSKFEDFTIGVGVQKKKTFNFKLIEESPLQLCRPITSLTGDYKKSKRVDYIKTLYSDSLSAVILIIDPSLQFNTENEKKFIKYCNMSTELHFDSIDSQIHTFKQSLLKEEEEKEEDNNNNNNNIKLSNGDFFITKHSNLSDVQVVFHLVIDSKNRTPLGGDNQLPTTSDIAKGLRNILLTASKYGIGNITIPICLTESELDLNVTNSNLLSRCVSVLSVTRASLTSLQEMTSIKTVQFSLPPQLDSGNTIFKGPIAQKWKSAINPFLYLSN